ncbi:MAG: MdtA/MuxA family multidrug efflux RND transporter periplasmic adaptor subunit [Acidobacteriota bacterium]|nr:MdtA/MuxA family multidrug efflux RND transporter periplasmic adaptor subunit [Acidobacteriota bacterium]
MAHFESTDLPKAAAPERFSVGAPPTRSRWWIWLLVVGVLVVGIWYYRGSHNKAEAESKNANPSNAPGGTSGGKGGRGGPGGAPVVPVVVATAQKGDLPVYFAGLGTVTAFNTVTVHSRVDGQLISVAFKEGQFVHQGDVLAQIDPRPYQVILEQAQGALAKDQAQRKDAETNLERFKLLYGEGVIAKQQMDTQAAQVGQFDGSIKTDEATINSAKLQLSYSRITAPISGRVGLRLVDAGNIVHASDPGGLVVITQLQPISVIFSLPQDQLPQVVTKLHAGGQLPVDAFDRDNTAKIASGTLASIDNQIDTTTGTYKLKAMFTNENNSLFPNQFVNVHLLVDTKRNLTIVPTAAIQRGPQGTYVYAVDSTNTAKIHNVTIAQTTSDSVGLSAGLNQGEVVVIDGQDKLQDGTKVNPSAGGSGKRPPGASADNSGGTPSPNTNPPGAPPTQGATRGNSR